MSDFEDDAKKPDLDAAAASALLGESEVSSAFEPISSSTPKLAPDAFGSNWSESAQAARSAEAVDADPADTAAAPFDAYAATAADPPVAPTPPVAWWAPPSFDTPALPPIPPTPGAPNAPKGTRSVLIGAISGALVGALVTGGLFVAFRDEDRTPKSVTSPRIDLSSNLRTPKVEPLSPAIDGGVDVQAVLKRMRPAVVEIQVETLRGAGGGTGVIISSDGVIVTNSHVVEGARDIKVRLADGDIVDAKIKGQDDSHDLAVLTIERTGLAAAVLGDSDQMNVGDPVVAIGNALGLGISVTTGIVSGLDRVVNEPNGKTLLGALQTDAAINPGNSGGPLVNSRGEVIGINTAIASPNESNNVGFAISISSAKPIIEALTSGRTPKDAFLGVASEDVTPSLVRTKSLKVTSGAFVTDVPSDIPASRAGIEQGDVIVELEGAPVTGSGQLRRLITRNPAGKDVEVVVVDKSGDRKTLTITLGERPTNEQ